MTVCFIVQKLHLASQPYQAKTALVSPLRSSMYALRTAETRCPLTPIHQNLCESLAEDGVPTLLPGRPCVDTPEAVLASLERLGDGIGARPTLQTCSAKLMTNWVS